MLAKSHKNLKLWFNILSPFCLSGKGHIDERHLLVYLLDFRTRLKFYSWPFWCEQIAMNSYYSVALMCQLLKGMNQPVASDSKCQAVSLVVYSSEVDACLCHHWVKNIQLWLGSLEWGGDSGQSQAVIAACGEIWPWSSQPIKKLFCIP